MFRRIYVVIAIVVLLIASGCSGKGNVTATPTQPAGIKSIRQAEIARSWAVKQLEINLESSTSILLTLSEGDEVNGYYYLTRGNNIGFCISGKSPIYQSEPLSLSSNNTSDRFSFTASGTQGIAYTLEFIPNEKGEGKKMIPSVFLEIIYPISGEIFVPMDTK